MEHRIVGGLIVAFALYTIYFSGNALLNAADHAQDMAGIASLFGQSLDRANFLFHWRVAYGTGVMLAALGLLAGVAMCLLQAWSWLLVAAIGMCCGMLSWVGVISGYTRYEFERVGVMSSVALFALAAVSLYAYRKWSRKKGHRHSA